MTSGSNWRPLNRPGIEGIRHIQPAYQPGAEKLQHVRKKVILRIF
jgi:hypothetical protein